MSLTAVTLVCTLTPSPADSSSDKMARDIEAELRTHDVANEIIRVVDHDVKPGVHADMGDGDAWPNIRKKILAADILIISTPIWVGHMSSIAQKVLERLDADISNTNENGDQIMLGKVAAVGVVGNEDGAHHVSAEIFQALSDTGFAIPGGAATYWVDVAMGSRDYKDFETVPENTAAATKTLAKNVAHLAALLRR